MATMKIVIVGDNLTAYTITKSLTHEAHDITLIGDNAVQIKHIEESLDIQTVCNPYTHIETYHTAECEQADIIIAITEIPEIDLLISLIATNLFQIPRVITVIHGSLYTHREALFPYQHHSQHLWISPTQLVSDNIIDLIEHPYCREMISIAENLCIARVQIENNDLPQCADWLAQLQKPTSPYQLITVIRHDQHIAHCTALQVDDHILLASPKDTLHALMKILKPTCTIQSIMIAGISSITKSIAEKIHRKKQVKIIEKDLDKATALAEKHNHITVLEGDINDTDLLIAEKIDQTDAFFALSDDDEDNLVAALQAKRHQVKQISALVHRREITPIVEENNIYSIEPQKILVDHIFKIIHDDLIQQNHSLHRHTGKILRCNIPKHLDQQPLSSLALNKTTKIIHWVRDGETLDSGKTPTLRYQDQIACYLADDAAVKQLLQQLRPPETSLLDMLTNYHTKD